MRDGIFELLQSLVVPEFPEEVVRELVARERCLPLKFTIKPEIPNSQSATSQSMIRLEKTNQNQLKDFKGSLDRGFDGEFKR